MEGIKRKVRSLLELAAEGSGATEHERATARAMASKLMAKNDLVEADIPKRETERRMTPPPPSPRSFVSAFDFREVHISVGGFRFDNSTSTSTAW